LDTLPRIFSQLQSLVGIQKIDETGIHHPALLVYRILLFSFGLHLTRDYDYGKFHTDLVSYPDSTVCYIPGVLSSFLSAILFNTLLYESPLCIVKLGNPFIGLIMWLKIKLEFLF